jgi:diguanylate cyclase (GGDEF)-like protein
MQKAPSTSAGHHADAGSPRVYRVVRILGAALVLGVLGLGITVLLDSRNDAWERAEQANANLAQALERDISRNMGVFDLSIQGTIEALRLPELAQVDGRVRRMALFDRSASAEYLGSVLVLSPEGDILASSSSDTPPALRLADRDYFRVHKERADAGLYLSLPFASRLRDGDPSIAISRRLDDADGQFAGVVVGTLRLAYFQERFGALRLGPGGSVTLFRTDSRVLARHPLREGDIGRDLSGSATLIQSMSAPSGHYMGTGALDGVERLYAFRRVAGFPMVINVAVAVDDVFAAWRGKALTIGTILVLLCTVLAMLWVLLHREMLRRRAAERRLGNVVEELAIAARTDGLTGLANRRCFDEVLERESLRSARERLPLSLILIDVDRFKIFNDCYGHQAGDACLQEVAKAVSQAILRPGDLAARYGGEELAVLLPNTEESGARHIAERLRLAVQGLGVVHEGNPPIGCVTISLGCATLVVSPRPDGASGKGLVAMADLALYEAKRGGRNRVVMAAGPLAASSTPDGQPRLSATG